jgi:tetratricopeptide (TPR) repeat protein
MKIRNFIFLFFVLIIFGGNTAETCSFPPDPYFYGPSYIDTDFESPDFSYAWYGRWGKFEIIIRQFVDLDSRQKSPSDTNIRKLSALEEPELYTRYLQGAEQFNAGDYKGAFEIFSGLMTTIGTHKGWLTKIFGKDDYSWVREASCYMVARCQLIIAQDESDGYDDPIGVVDQSVLMAADSSFRQYLKDYPDGIYATSAQNIRRKIYFLSDQQSILNQELRRAMLERFPASAEFAPESSVNNGIIGEFLHYFDGAIDFANDSPMLIAYALLGHQKPDTQEVKALETRENDFSAYPGLFRYLRAVGLYRLGCYQELLEKIPEESPNNSKIWLSTQILRARVLEKLGDDKAALDVFEKMHSVSPEDALDIEIAALKINNGDGLWLFTGKSPVNNEMNLRAFAICGLSDKELEAGVAMNEITGIKRQILADELARRYILTGRFIEANNLLKNIQVPILAPVDTIIANLARNSQNVKALVEMGEFIFDNIGPSSTLENRANYMGRANPINALQRCDPCKNFAERAASYTPPISLFLKAVEISKNKKARSESEAKALHYIVMAGRDGHYHEQCAWGFAWADSVIIAGNRDAFVRLHKLYKNSPWTEATPYYYR